ncbi:hypothetical protein ACFFF5_06100 [Lederbergia wuyishanensis]|uniref:Uncharacterized protein n=1 Tax=Lederbergia wuyishanensis TaxID=1347903 RepID=A0ABU0D313_9BACI|nr:hypothetical protein [Lederbergia wuyishanensis]MCJ8007060.1 hypothetical protein [Lederbergia wuyishanensis]MDQ0342796.1 hypothetical protein [Lederbergia wuyishanensis]
MNKKIWLYIVVFSTFLFLLIVPLTQWQSKNKYNRINGIEHFSPETSDSQGHYLLFYPTDYRFSKGFTLVKEVTNTGEVVKQYRIFDDDFGRMIPHQKPNDMNQLYISFFGGMGGEYYFTYDIQKNIFKKVNVDYLENQVGVDHIEHYGDDIVFQTLASHKTGDQRYNENFDGFKVSISNATTQQSIETDYHRSPLSSPILHFGGKILYATAGTVGDEDEYEYHGIGVTDLNKESITYETFSADNVDLTPLFSTDNHAYILGANGKMYVYDQDFQYKVFEPFKNEPTQDYYIYGDGQLALDEHRILYCLSGEEDKHSLGIFHLKDEPVFELFNQEFANTDSWYELLYQNAEEKEIYVKEMSNAKSKNHIIVLDSESLDVKTKFPVSDNHLLDFIVKIK